MNPKQEIVPIEMGRSFEGYLEMANLLLRVALGSRYVTESAARSADQRLFASFWDEVNRVPNAAASVASNANRGGRQSCHDAPPRYKPTHSVERIVFVAVGHIAQMAPSRTHLVAPTTWVVRWSCKL